MKTVEINGEKQLELQIPPQNEISEEIKVICTGEKSMELGKFLLDRKYHFRIINEGGYLGYILLPLPEKEREEILIRMYKHAQKVIDILFILSIISFLLLFISIISPLGSHLMLAVAAELLASLIITSIFRFLLKERGGI